MNTLIILCGIGGATLFWLLNRWTARHGGRAGVYIFWMLLTSAIVSGPLAVLLQQPLLVAAVWGWGAVIGLATALCMWLIMFCLRIGPTGPAVTVNNMGMVWPVLVGVLYLNPRPATGGLVVGLLAVFVALTMLGFSRPKAVMNTDGSTLACVDGRVDVSAEPLLLPAMLLLWVVAGVSMAAQAIAGHDHPYSPMALVFTYSLVGSFAFAPVFFHLSDHIRRVEVWPGLLAGVAQVVTGWSVFLGVTRVGPERIFPFVIATPIILMLLVGHFVLRERLSRQAWTACAVGAAGLVLLCIA